MGVALLGLPHVFLAPALYGLNAYGEKYRAAASVDPLLGDTFLRVANMIDRPAKLLSPGHVLRVFRAAGKAVRAGA